MENPNLADGDSISDKVQVNLHMLRPLMLNWVRREVHGADIVAVDKRALGERAVKLRQELTQPGRLRNAVSNSPVLRLCTGAGDDRLSLGRPGDQVAAEEDGVPRSGATCVRTASPVSVGVDDKLGGRRSVKSKTAVNCATNVAKKPLQRGKMRLSRIMHMKADLLNCIRNIRPGESEVEQGTSDTLVSSRVSNRSTLSCRKLGLSIDRSGTRLAVSHTRSLQNLKCILALVKEEARGTRLNSDTQKVMELTEILHSKLLL